MNSHEELLQEEEKRSARVRGVLRRGRGEVEVMRLGVLSDKLISAEFATEVIKIHQLDTSFPSITLQHFNKVARVSQHSDIVYPRKFWLRVVVQRTLVLFGWQGIALTRCLSNVFASSRLDRHFALTFAQRVVLQVALIWSCAAPASAKM